MVWTEKHVVAELNDPIDALATNKDRSYVAVAGRTGMKVFAVGSNKFELRSDLRKTRKTSMHYYLSLAWSSLRENLIASSLLNGAVLLWDLDNYQASYPEQQYKAHKQAATKVCFSEFNEHLLISGSKEGIIFLYDIRTPEPSLSFSNKETIRDLQFCMESKLQDIFVTADDSGSVRFWDLKRPDRVFKEFIAHTGHVSSIALNPQLQSKNLIATAGRDKFIRVWDWSKQSPERLYTVETMAPLTRVSWCPDNAWHLASCSTANDNNIHVWDIRRPYLPFASFCAHTDTVTDMCWPRYGAGDRFISSGKDGRLILNFMDQAVRPLNYANTVALSCSSAFDGIVVALPERKRSSSCTSADALDPFRRNVPSVLYCAMPLEADATISRSKTISYLAKNYKLFGGPVERLCSLNAVVAERAFSTAFNNRNAMPVIGDELANGDDGSCQLACSWRTVALLCAGTDLAGGGGGGGGGRSSATQFLLTRSELYRRSFGGLDGGAKLTAGQIEANLLGVEMSGTGNLAGGHRASASDDGKMADAAAGAHDEADSGSESDESSSSDSAAFAPGDANASTSALGAADAPIGGGGMVARNSGRRRRRRALAAATALISGSLSQITQNSLNADFFFGVNELNLCGMSGSSTNNNGTNKMDANNNYGGRNALNRRVIRLSGSKNARTNDGKQPQPNYSWDISKVKDEAFDFRAYRQHLQHKTSDHDDFSHRCPQPFGEVGNFLAHQNSDGQSAQPVQTDSLYTQYSYHTNQSGAHNQSGNNNSQRNYHYVCGEKFYSGIGYNNARFHKTESNEDGLDSEEDGGNLGGADSGEGVSASGGGEDADEEGSGEEEVDVIGEEEVVVDLMDDCVDDTIDVQMSASFPTSAANSISGDELELNAVGGRFGVAGPAFWDPLPRIKALLEYFSEMGDVQTCAAICLVLGEKLAELKLIKIAQIELWFFAYLVCFRILELLERLELWNATAAFIKMCYRSKINQLSNESTFVKSVCTNCRTVSLKSSTRCRECAKLLNARCCTCEQIVRGVWSACAECGHGGHVAHMSAWFEQFSFCPFLGCGHLCAAASFSSSSARLGNMGAGRNNPPPHNSQQHQRSPYSLTPPSSQPPHSQQQSQISRTKR